jgi:tripartite-type tricarboxylate transporter receptor subunit TctC
VLVARAAPDGNTLLINANPFVTNPHLGLPTVVESGYKNYSEEAWFGLVAPAKTSKETISQMSNWFTAAPETKAKLLNQGPYPVGVCGPDFATVIRN